MSTYDLMEQHDGFAVKKTDENGKEWFVRVHYRGEYTWTSDHTYAFHYSRKTAEKHLKALRKAEDEMNRIDPAELDDCLDRINDLAWEIISKKDLQWVYPTEPIYPLKWYICYGKAPVEFIKAVMNFGKRTLANILVTWRDNDTMDIIRKIERRIL